MTASLRISSAAVFLAVTSFVLAPVHTFVQPFGLPRQNPSAASFIGPSSVTPSPVYKASPLWARGKKDDEEEDWEPSEEDLINDLEDLTLDDVDDDVVLEDDSTVMINDDEEEESKEEEDDDDDDEDVDLDLWEDDDEEIEEETDGEWDEEYEYYEEEEQPSTYLGAEADEEDEDWEEDEGYEDVPIMDDPEDPNYMAQKKLVEDTIARREQLQQDKDFDEVEYLLNGIPPEMAQAFDDTEFIKKAREMEEKMLILNEDDFDGMDLKSEMEKTPDLLGDDPYEAGSSSDILGVLTDDDMQAIDDAYKRIQQTLAKEPWDKVEYKAQLTDFELLDNQTIYEMDACLDEIQGSSYNCTRWLLYDLDFNVSNLILAAVKHNREAPIIFQHWFPQLMTYSRYEHARDRNFEFNWEDVEKADVSELERYYQGFGYDEIPKKAPAETGIIGLEDLDEEELKMAAFENWMIEVYNPEWDRKDFDDDNFQDEDNVFSEFFEEPQHPDLPTYEDALEDIQNWEEDMEEEGETNQEYLEFMAKEYKYNLVEDEEFKKEFRGHLIIACTPTDDDVEVAERITNRMREEFGKKVYVETRVMAHAREEDNVFEVWLESYEIDLLHSKKRASNSDNWDGPAECDDQQVEYLVDQVRYLISDEARYSYRFQLDKEMIA